MVLATFVSAVFFWMTMKIIDLFVLDTTRTLNLIILTLVTSAIGFSVYFIWTKIFDLKEAENVVEILKKVTRLRENFSLTQEIIDDSAPLN